MVKNSMHTLVFAIVLGVTCSLLLVAANRITTPYREANEKAEEVRNILAALGAEVPADATAGELLKTFERNVREDVRANGSVYAYVPDNVATPVAIAVPFYGAGVWGPIEGVMALEPDLNTIRGIRFYKQEETPGLGGEISSDWFQKQFRDKTIRGPGGEVGLRVRKSGERGGKNVVDGITGATMTSDRVETMLNDMVRRLQEGS